MHIHPRHVWEWLVSVYHQTDHSPCPVSELQKYKPEEVEQNWPTARAYEIWHKMLFLWQLDASQVILCWQDVSLMWELEVGNPRGVLGFKLRTLKLFLVRLELNQPAKIIRHKSILGNMMSLMCHFSPFLTSQCPAAYFLTSSSSLIHPKWY